jgi:hypothetical protein
MCTKSTCIYSNEDRLCVQIISKNERNTIISPNTAIFKCKTIVHSIYLHLEKESFGYKQSFLLFLPRKTNVQIQGITNFPGGTCGWLAEREKRQQSRFTA